MYMEGQIVYDWDRKEPFIMGDVWDVDSYPERHSHFIKSSGEMISKKDRNGLFLQVMEISCPKTVEDAKKLLAAGLIVPSPLRIR